MNSTETLPDRPTSPETGVEFRYEETRSLFASQFVVNSLGETVLLDCSSGFLTDAESGDPYLPIHRRISMTAETARKLGKLLVEVADELEEATLSDERATQCMETLLAAAGVQSGLNDALASLPRAEAPE